MIETVHLKNYKCYGPEGARFDLKPLTFLYGTNGAGKSTFLQALFKLREWEESRSKDDNAYLSANYAFKKNVQQPIEIGVTLSSSDNGKIKVFKRACLTKLPDDVGKVKSDKVESSLTDANRSFVGSSEWKIQVDKINPAMTEQERKYALADFMQMRHLGAMRPDIKIAKRGQASSLADLEQPEVARMDGVKAVLNADEINRMLAKIGFSDFEFINHEELKDKLYDVTIPWKSTGAGVHNIAFTLDAIAKLQPNGILLLEEPETHMDPQYLKAFAEVIVDAIHKNQGAQIIVECHSEHLMLAIKQLIRMKKFAANDIVANFIKRTEKGAEVKAITLGEDGQFKPEWPDGFYRERRKLISDVER